jgi:hypothetical protein
LAASSVEEVDWEKKEEREQAENIEENGQWKLSW